MLASVFLISADVLDVGWGKYDFRLTPLLGRGRVYQAF